MMFDTIAAQPVCLQLADDISHNTLPSSLLFAGPEYAGKLTTALELARIVSCEKTGEQLCKCKSCMLQSELAGTDVLIIGTKDIVSELKAVHRMILTDYTPDTRSLLIRSVRKLTMRFDSRLWDSDESRYQKAAPLLADIEEHLSDFTTRYSVNLAAKDKEKLEKTLEKLLSSCEKLQEECLYSSIPVNQIRKAAAWVRIIPSGKKKVLIVENADKMQEAARNAFLKILEEPPQYTQFILTTAHRGAIIPTILSRVRTYVFYERNADIQKSIISTVFHDETYCRSEHAILHIGTYLQTFLPVPHELFFEAAACFWEYIFQNCNQASLQSLSLVQCISTYRKFHTPQTMQTIADMVKALHGCKPHRLYTLFLYAVSSFLQQSIRTGSCPSFELEYYAIFSQYLQDAVQVVEIFNLNPQAALENLADQTIQLFCEQ
ncbi:MAG: hypothetical protein ACTTH7_02170 [Treponema sp.]